jgi:hypothetical protein
LRELDLRGRDVAVIVDPDAGGRGPRHFGQAYLVELDDDSSFYGTYVGFARGATKGADTLIFRPFDGGPVRAVQYRHLEGAHRLRVHDAPCGGWAVRLRADGPWFCFGCKREVPREALGPGIRETTVKSSAHTRPDGVGSAGG